MIKKHRPYPIRTGAVDYLWIVSLTYLILSFFNIFARPNTKKA